MQNENIEILLAEDEEITARFIRISLERLGYKIAGVVSKGEDLILQLIFKLPTIIISDISLRGELDGIEALARIQEDNKIPYIFITAHNDLIPLLKSYGLNPCYLIKKPFEISMLDSTIHKCLAESLSHS